MFMTLEESLAPWVLLLEQKPYMSYIKKVEKTILQTTDPYTTILKNQPQKILDKIIGECQSAATVCTIRDIIDLSSKLNKIFR